MKLPLEDTFISWSIAPSRMDELWAAGWWYLGPVFFRRAFIEWGGRLAPLQHLRVDLARYQPSTSQKRILRRNAELRVEIRAPVIDSERRELFERHKERFREGIPRDLEDFLGPTPATGPVPAREFAVYDGDRLLAISFLAVGGNSVASLYCSFEPAESRRSLGIFTLLRELEWARANGCRYHYPGYALLQPSPMDYKKTLEGLEEYDWGRAWKRFPRVTPRPVLVPLTVRDRV